jgi:hypothetical protein
MSLSVCLSYVMVIPWRKHPSSLVLYRSLTSILFSINIITEAMYVLYVCLSVPMSVCMEL